MFKMPGKNWPLTENRFDCSFLGWTDFFLELDSGKEPEVNMSGELIRDDLPWKEAYNDPTSTEYKQLAEDTCKQVSKGKHTSNHGNCIIHYCPYRAIQAMYRCNVKLMIMWWSVMNKTTSLNGVQK